MLAYASAAAIAQKTNRNLHVIWIPDEYCQAKFSELFEKPYSVKNLIEDSVSVDTYRNADTIFYDYMSHTQHNQAIVFTQDVPTPTTPTTVEAQVAGQPAKPAAAKPTGPREMNVYVSSDGVLNHEKADMANGKSIAIPSCIPTLVLSWIPSSIRLSFRSCVISVLAPLFCFALFCGFCSSCFD